MQLTHFRILGVVGDGFGLKCKTGNVAAHILHTEVKNEWSYFFTFSVCLNDIDRDRDRDSDNVAFYLLQYSVFCSFVRVQRLLYGFG